MNRLPAKRTLLAGLLALAAGAVASGIGPATGLAAASDTAAALDDDAERHGMSAFGDLKL